VANSNPALELAYIPQVVIKPPDDHHLILNSPFNDLPVIVHKDLVIFVYWVTDHPRFGGSFEELLQRVENGRENGYCA